MFQNTGMENIKIRTATVNDLPVLLEFEQGVIAAERPFDGTLKEDPVQYYDLEFMINAEHVELVVAEIDGIVAGSGYIRIETSKLYHKHAQHGYLGFMYVRPEYRGKGINNRIMDVLRQWALSKNIQELRLEVYAGNLPAIRAYTKTGFTHYMMQMRLGLDDDHNNTQ